MQDKGKDKRRILKPQSRAAWREWLSKNHASSPGIRIAVRKKGYAGLRYEEAVEEALCFGWIDSHADALDEGSFTINVSPRKPRSVWSRINKNRVEKLIESGAMTAAGMAKIEAARKDGSWSAMDGVEAMVIPPDLEEGFRKNAEARRNFAAFNDSSKKIILWWIQSAKQPHTRARRISDTVEKAALNLKAGIASSPRGPSPRPPLPLSGHDTIIKGMNKAEAYPLLVCTPKSIPRNLRVSAAAMAVRINPVNHPPIERMMSLMPGFPLEEKGFLAVLTTKYWQAKGVELTVGFMDSPSAALKKRILLHMNAWDKTGNVRFTASAAEPQVRIARLDGRDGGYWSYLGTDILSIPAREPTMNLEGFTMDTPESEFHRVVRHETGHTLGFPHEHVRRALVALIDPKKAIAYFKRTQGWSAEEVRAQVLTPIEESSLLGTEKADPRSIMCYQIPGEITRSGKPIPGGEDINASDYEFIGKIYPKPGAKKKKRA